MSGSVCFKNTYLWLLIAVTFITTLLPSFPAQSKEPVKTMIVVDGSRSMWQRVKRKRKYRTVLSGLSQLLAAPPNNNAYGVMTFGRKSRRSCKDVEILKPVSSTLSKKELKKIKSIRPRGRSPISLAMIKAAEQLDHENNAVRIILLVDGYDNCRRDPCDTLADLRRTAYDMSVQLVGLGLRKKDIKHYQCFTKHSSDSFYATNNRNEFLAALFIALGGQHNDSGKDNYKPPAVNAKQISSLLKGASRVKLMAILAEGTPLLREGVSWRIYNALNDSSFRGLPVATSKEAQPVISLKPGNYVAEARYGDARTELAVIVPKSGLLSHVINMNAGLLQVETKERDEGKKLEGVFYAIYELDEKNVAASTPIARSTKAAPRFYLREGKYLLRAVHGGNKIEKSVHVEPGGQTTITLLMNIGTLKLKTVSSRGAEALDRIFYSIFKNEENTNPDDLKNGDEVMRTAAAQPTLKLPAGHYIIKAEHDLAHAFRKVEIKSGELSDIQINLKASILKLQTLVKGKKKIIRNLISYRLYRFKKDGIKNLVEIARTSEAEKSYILTPGKYRITGRYGTINAVKDLTTTLMPGGKKKVTIIHNAGKAELSLIDKKGGFPRIDVFWLIYDKDNQEIWRTSRPTPELILLAGKYKAIAESQDKRLKKEFSVKIGKKTDVKLQTSQ